MARSNGHAAVVALLCAFGYLLAAQLTAFVSPASQFRASDRNLRSRVSLAATTSDVDAAEKDFKLKKWAAEQLAGSAQEAAAVARAQQAEATYAALKAELEGTLVSAPAMPTPVAAMPVAAPVVAAPVAAAPSAVSKADLAAAKQNAQLLTWSANKLMSEGAPQAAAMKAKADQAVAAFEALKQGQASGVAAPAAPVPVAAAPVAAAPVVAPVATGVSKEDLAKAKQAAQLLTWSANKLMSEGAPQAAAMKAKADQAVAAFEALKQADASGAAMPAAPAAPTPVAVAPVATAPVASSPAAPSPEALLKAKKEMELHAWAAERLASSGSLQAAVMKAKAEQSRQAYEALQEMQSFAR